MKWLLIFFSVFKPFFSVGTNKVPDHFAEIKDIVKANAVKVMLTLGTLSALSTIFAAGIVMVAVDIGAQYDQNATVYFSAMILNGFMLILIPAILIAIAVKVLEDDNKKTQKQVLTSANTTHPLQDALALLVQDFVKEREMKREMKNEAQYKHKKTTDNYPSEDALLPLSEARLAHRDSQYPAPDDFRH